MDDAFPDRLALENLFDGQRVDQCGCSAVLAFDGKLGHYPTWRRDDVTAGKARCRGTSSPVDYPVSISTS
jgi:hypothetical protein